VVLAQGQAAAVKLGQGEVTYKGKPPENTEDSATGERVSLKKEGK